MTKIALHRLTASVLFAPGGAGRFYYNPPWRPDTYCLQYMHAGYPNTNELYFDDVKKVAAFAAPIFKISKPEFKEAFRKWKLDGSQ